MNGIMIIGSMLLYFMVLRIYSRFATGNKSDNETFFRAGRKSPWYMVAFGMVGASISGVTFISVPGMVNTIGMTYMQTCLGFIVGYVLVAFLLLPLYYKFNLTTIYSCLNQRLGNGAYKTGATFFLLSKMTGAAVRFYVVCIILQHYVLDNMHVPFIATVTVLVALIWLYTRDGGIKTLVWTDTFQTACMFTALALIIWHVINALGMNMGEAVNAIIADERSHWFEWDDMMSKQYFWKQFLSGIFIVIVMTGLDQDMMQKNLTCKSLRDAQKDMCCYGLAFVPANLLFLCLGVLLSMLCQKEGLPLPAAGDELLPMFAASGRLGDVVVVLFTIGIMAASFSSADSALTSMTTSYCVDLRNGANDEKLRRRTHVMMAVIFGLIIICVQMMGADSVIDTIYTICSYTYGPLLGLFLYAYIMGKDHGEREKPLRNLKGSWVAMLCVASPLICYVMNMLTRYLWNYSFGYELLMINGAITYLGLLILQYLPARR